MSEIYEFAGYLTIMQPCYICGATTNVEVNNPALCQVCTERINKKRNAIYSVKHSMGILPGMTIMMDVQEIVSSITSAVIELANLIEEQDNEIAIMKAVEEATAAKNDK